MGKGDVGEWWLIEQRRGRVKRRGSEVKKRKE
jgi:hypothetical protein